MCMLCNLIEWGLYTKDIGYRFSILNFKGDTKKQIRGAMGIRTPDILHAMQAL